MSAYSQGLERLKAGFEEAGFEVVSWRGAHPCEIELDAVPGKHGPVRYALFLHRIEPDGRREGSTFAQVSGRARASDPEPERALLTLGYEPGLDVFAGWPAHDFGSRHRERLWVPWRALLEAADTGFAEPRTNSLAFAFRPSEVGAFLRAHKRQREERAAAQGVDDVFAARSMLDSGSRRLYKPTPAEMEIWRAPTPPFERPKVETSIAAMDAPSRSLPAATPLAPEHRYLFRFGIGAKMDRSIEEDAMPPPTGLPADARLSVQLYPFEGEIEMEGSSRGELELGADGRASVLRPAASVPDQPGLSERVLFFEFLTGQRAGDQRFRCNLYYGSTLLQSRLVTCRVGDGKGPDASGMRSEVDYALTSVLDPEVLARVPAHDLSLMVNQGGSPREPTHEFRFFADGNEPLVANAYMEAQLLGTAIRGSRGALRFASWETREEWDKKKPYRYEDEPAEQSLFEEDLFRMAIEGRRLYIGITRKFSDGAGRKEIAETTREPCRIQIASADAGLYVPAALFYDYPLEASPGTADLASFRLCEAFAEALNGSDPLEESRCMKGDCPTRQERDAVCPSGFWGFRHEIGWPVGTEDPVTAVEFERHPHLAIGVSTDPKLKHREDHAERIKSMGSGEIAESRDALRDLVKGVPLHLVYLYCHGGLTEGDGMPFLELGPPDSAGLDSPYLVDEEIEWGDPPPRPVVFINGCQTTALDPESLADLVGGFVEDANAIGVLGTEITVFEPLACAFAESVLGHFLDGTMTIGEAIKRTRLMLLRARNPLGLAYVPFLAAATRLVPAGGGTAKARP